MFMGYYPQESLYKPYKYHGYTVRGTPNCPLIQCSSTVPTLFGLHFQLVTPISPGFSDEPLVQDRIGWLAVLLSLSGPRSYMGVNPKIVGFYHKSSIFNRVFHYKPSILGYPYFWKHPYGVQPDIRVENKIQ